MTAVSARIRFGAVRSRAVPRYTLTDTVRVWCDFYDPGTGAAVEVSSVSARIWLPGGAQLDPEAVPVREGVGVWYVDVTPTFEGLWRVEIFSAVPDAAASARDFLMVSAVPAGGPVPDPTWAEVDAQRIAAAASAAQAAASASAAESSALSIPPLLHDLPGKAFAEFYPGVDRTGEDPQSDALNDCIQQYISEGNPVAIGAGLYLLDKSLIYRTGMQFIASSNARFSAAFGLYGASAVGSEVWVAPNKAAAVNPATRERDIIIKGGIWGRPGTLVTDEFGTGMLSIHRGDVFQIFADNVVLDRVQVIGYPHGRAIAGGGRNIRVLYPYIRHPTRLRDYPDRPRSGSTTSAAIRWSFGEEIFVYGVDAHSADDGLQFVASEGGLFVGLDYRNCGYIGGRILSHSNSACVLNLNEDVPGRVVENLFWTDIHAKAGGTVLRARCLGGARADNISFINITVEDSGFRDNAQAISIIGTESGPDVGGLGTVTLRDIRAKEPTAEIMRVEGAVRRLIVENVEGTAPAVPTTGAVINIYGPRELVMKNVAAVAGNGDGVLIGGRTRTSSTIIYPEEGDPETITFTRRGLVEAVTIENLTVTGLQPGKRGVNIANADGGALSRLRFAAVTAGGAADGVLLSRGATNFEVDDVDVREIAGTPVTNLGVNNSIGRIYGSAVAAGAVEVVGARRININASIGRAHSPTTARALGFNSARDLILVNQNAARWSPSRSLLIAEGRVFSNTDPLGVGGSVGVIGSGGAVPTGWLVSSTTGGITIERLANEMFGTVSVPVFRFHGTPSNTTQTLIWYMANATSVEGEQWAYRAYAALLAGSTANMTLMQLQMRFGASVGNADADMLSALTEELTATSIVGTAGAGDTTARGRFRFAFTNGQPVDITLALTGFLEKGRFTTLPAVPGDGLTGSVTRGRDIITYPLPAGAQTQGYVSGAVLLNRVPVGADAGILVLDAGADANRIVLDIADGTTAVRLRSIVSSTTEITATHGAMEPDTVLRFALAYDRNPSPGTLRLAVTGMDEVLTVSGTLPASLTQLGVGRGRDTGGTEINGEVIGMSSGSGEIANNTLLSLVAG